MKKTVGIIGFGSFGQFMAKHLKEWMDIYFYDINEFAVENGYKRVGLEEVCNTDFLILAVPVQKLETTLKDIAKFLTDKTLVIDVCSIKIMPMELLEKYIPSGVNYLGTHPLFGPKSSINGIKGLNIALCKGRINSNRYNKFKKFLVDSLALNVIETTAIEHDKQMAYIQGLTHFIAKAFSQMELPELFLTTASFDHFSKIKDIISLDSEELYNVIQNLNPYTKEVRSELLSNLDKLNDNSKI